MSQSHRERSFRSYLSRRVVVPWLVIGVLLLIVAAGSGSDPWISLPVDPLLALGVAHLLVLWKILTTLQSIEQSIEDETQTEY
ncbi:hypothetical protein [Halapricum salinum]|uniref:Uncharacterized protein n=1 Tax=Halapricum salinum TaxID=1457250 RepID=A0A4D6HHY5_9EURY|nr:hypothetical protein [Halapricum salinum]QCC52632.1 hypothetical protein DV733_15960 [Halapricum salinum]